MLGYAVDGEPSAPKRLQAKMLTGGTTKVRITP